MFINDGVPELGAETAPTAAAAASSGGWSWSDLLDNVGKAVEIGGSIYSKYIDDDAQNAALELAKLQARTAEERARAAQLQTVTKSGGGAASGWGIGGGVGLAALAVGGGVLLWVLLRQKR